MLGCQATGGEISELVAAIFNQLTRPQNIIRTVSLSLLPWPLEFFDFALINLTDQPT